jgi:hypothetical protein
MNLMTLDDDKDPPVPADLVDAPKRIHHDPASEDPDPSDDEALPDGQDD